MGGFPEHITAFQDSRNGLEIQRCPSMEDLMSMNALELDRALDALNGSDHVVFRLSGENPAEFLKVLSFRGQLHKFIARKYSASFWTMDSHHLGRQEVKAHKHFDNVFVAPSSYIEGFDVKKAMHLPCSFSLTTPSIVVRHLGQGTGF